MLYNQGKYAAAGSWGQMPAIGNIYYCTMYVKHFGRAILDDVDQALTGTL